MTAEERAECDSGAPRGVQPFEDWLTEKLEEQREKYKSGPRSENPRQTDIALGRLRAFRDARTEYLNRKHDTGGDSDAE